jgi:hypothetical protein
MLGCGGKSGLGGSGGSPGLGGIDGFGLLSDMRFILAAWVNWLSTLT